MKFRSEIICKGFIGLILRPLNWMVYTLVCLFLVFSASVSFGYNVLILNTTNLDLSIVTPKLSGEWGFVYVNIPSSAGASSYYISKVNVLSLPAGVFLNVPIDVPSTLNRPVYFVAYQWSAYMMTLSPTPDEYLNRVCYCPYCADLSCSENSSGLPVWASSISGLVGVNAPPPPLVSSPSGVSFCYSVSFNMYQGGCNTGVQGLYYTGNPLRAVVGSPDFNDSSLVKAIQIQLDNCYRPCQNIDPECSTFVYDGVNYTRVYFCPIPSSKFPAFVGQYGEGDMSGMVKDVAYPFKGVRHSGGGLGGFEIWN